ncbi:MAG TPA: efflux RND transporter periplasmic adaptor subunit [Bryobacteraceae bacterium]|nr:efflux RND transporter periplasmic adaptor subunit [Bryobacteraceae bacterium]
MSSKPRNILFIGLATAWAVSLASCGASGKVQSKDPGDSNSAAVSVGVVKVGRKDLGRMLTLSSELVPFQEIDVYAKESGFVKQLDVDYGTHVKANQILATLEIPELQLQVKQDEAAIKNAQDQITHANNELSRVEAQHKVLQLQFDRLDSVSKSRPGLVAQQEVDESQGKALASAAQVEAAQSNLQSAESQLEAARAKREHDQVLFDYSKITAPFAGVVTQRYANLGTLLQAGTNSSTQAMPLVRLSQDDVFRLVIPVPESYVHYIRLGQPVKVNVPSLDRTFPGTVKRFSADVREDTRTMHTEVEVLNPSRVLLPGMYAEATITLEQKRQAVAVPLQAVNQEDGQTSVYIVDPLNKIERRKIALGIQTATDAEVVSGLHGGEMVVVSDRSSLKPGEEVRTKVIELVQYQGQDDQN